MSDIAIQIDQVWKKFRKGEVHDSLRELIPALFRRMLGKTQQQQNLKECEFWALKDVSFEVKKGESLGIIGPNGAGKSTMLKVLSRILKPNRGSYRIDGRLTALIEVGAGFHPDLTGRENIYLNGTILGMTRQEIKAREEQIIDFAAIDGFIDTPVKRYSSGMGARLGFAIAAHLRTDVLLVDEVLSVGDARFRHKCITHMNKLLRSGITVVFISHILDQVRSLCPRTVVLDKGEVVYNGATDGAIRTYLDRLGANEQEAESTAGSVAEIRDIRLCDVEGNETLEWRVGEAGYVEFELVMHKPCLAVQIGVDIATISGTYIGSVNSNQQMTHLVPSKALGTFTVRMGISPMPLADGDYNLSFNVFIYDMEDKHQHVWQSRQPRIVPIRGNEPGGMIVQMKSQWDVRPGDAGGDGAPIPYPKPLPPTGSL